MKERGAESGDEAERRRGGNGGQSERGEENVRD